MKQKKIVNALIIVLVSSGLLWLWFLGFNVVYAKFLSFGTNIFLLPWPDTHVAYREYKGMETIMVFTDIYGGQSPFQDTKLILLPTIMILTWQILMFFNLSLKKALLGFAENFGIFYLIQIIFIMLLWIYNSNDFAHYIYDLLIDSFYIIALFLILKDAVKYRLIRLK